MKIVVVLVVIAVFTLSFSYAAEPEKMAKVIATGVGIDLDKAKQNAIRNAVEQVIGTYVSSDTLVQNNQVIKDQILSYSGGYVKETKVLSEEKTDDGLFTTKIEALVISTKIRKKIESLNIAVKKVEGESLFGEAFSRVESQKSAQQILDSTLSKFPEAAYTFDIGKPSILGTNPNSGIARVSIPIVLKWDEAFLAELKGTLSKVAGLEMSSAEIDSFERGSNRNYKYGNKIVCLAKTNGIKKGYADVCFILGNQSGSGSKRVNKKMSSISRDRSDELTPRLDFSSKSLISKRYDNIPITLIFKNVNGDIKDTTVYELITRDWIENVSAILNAQGSMKKQLSMSVGAPNEFWRNSGPILIVTDGEFRITPEVDLDINLIKSISKIEVSVKASE